MGKEELHFATGFSAKQTTENEKEVLRLVFCGVLRRNKHALNEASSLHVTFSGSYYLQAKGNGIKGQCTILVISKQARVPSSPFFIFLSTNNLTSEFDADLD